MAALTTDDKATIGASLVFHDRIAAILRGKAHYWKNFDASTRDLVNQQTQKRKKLAKNILTTNWVDSFRIHVSQYWVSQYDTSNPALDGNNLPTSDAINDSFDPTYDYWAGYITGDENQTEIDW